MNAALSMPPAEPSAFFQPAAFVHRSKLGRTFRWQNGKCTPLHSLSPALANAIQTTLNLNADGAPLNYRDTRVVPTPLNGDE